MSAPLWCVRRASSTTMWCHAFYAPVLPTILYHHHYPSTTSIIPTCVFFSGRRRRKEGRQGDRRDREGDRMEGLAVAAGPTPAREGRRGEAGGWEGGGGRSLPVPAHHYHPFPVL